jgi:catechol 2,3-dioxygenase-like lactoylglutathione lyase family enzyme|tara:strand:- start:2000 stop:2449 length:450 start_codon:yes stop_codon:yes gene_type:complete
MEATGISHIAVCVRDMDKALAFYRDILGMKVKKDFIEDTSTGGLTHTYKHKRDNRRTVYLDWGQDQFFVMTSHPGDKTDGDAIKLDQVGVSHVSFTVKDIRALADELIAKGVEIAGGIEAFADAEGNVRTFFAFDPDGILVQFDSGIAS